MYAYHSKPFTCHTLRCAISCRDPESLVPRQQQPSCSDPWQRADCQAHTPACQAKMPRGRPSTPGSGLCLILNTHTAGEPLPQNTLFQDSQSVQDFISYSSKSWVKLEISGDLIKEAHVPLSHSGRRQHRVLNDALPRLVVCRGGRKSLKPAPSFSRCAGGGRRG